MAFFMVLSFVIEDSDDAELWALLFWLSAIANVALLMLVRSH